MHYFYYFINNGAYYGGITNNIARRTCRHNYDLKRNRKSESKPWHLIQGKIVLTILWVFNTKKEAVVYEKQWIFANYKNDNCLNCSVSNSEYDYVNHEKLCLQGRTKAEHRELCEQNGGFKAKPFLIKEYPSNQILLEANSTNDEKAQKFLKMSQSQISNQLNREKVSLFIRLKSGQIVYLEYVDQSLSERAELLGRSIESDYAKAKAFKLTLNLQHKDGRKAFLENYTSYYEAGRMLGLKTRSELCGFCQMISGKRPSSSGWSLVTEITS